MREVMYPYTAMKLKEGEKVKIQEYLKMAGVYKISHMIVFTSTENSNYLKVMKNPDGPTITFKVLSYSNQQDFTQIQLNPKTYSRSFNAPLLIMNGFSSNDQSIKITGMLLQSLFPPLNIAN
jgi:ribosome biogenesis protein SSF1/2